MRKKYLVVFTVIICLVIMEIIPSAIVEAKELWVWGEDIKTTYAEMVSNGKEYYVDMDGDGKRERVRGVVSVLEWSRADGNYWVDDFDYIRSLIYDVNRRNYSQDGNYQSSVNYRGNGDLKFEIFINDKVEYRKTYKGEENWPSEVPSFNAITINRKTGEKGFILFSRSFQEEYFNNSRPYGDIIISKQKGKWKTLVDLGGISFVDMEMINRSTIRTIATVMVDGLGGLYYYQDYKIKNKKLKPVTKKNKIYKTVSSWDTFIADQDIKLKNESLSKTNGSVITKWTSFSVMKADVGSSNIKKLYVVADNGAKGWIDVEKTDLNESNDYCFVMDPYFEGILPFH